MNTSMNRYVLCAAILLTSLIAACNNYGGSGGGTVIGPTPPPPTGNFSNASLKGQYAFLMNGSELCSSFAVSGSFFTLAGSFTADGNGHITAGLEDLNSCSGTFTLQITNSTYSITANGRGTLRLTTSTGMSNYSITLSSADQGFMVETDMSATTSGSFQKQNTAAFSVPAIAGGYVFDFSGISVAFNPESIIGRFTADGAGGISNGVFDSNEAGTLSGQLSLPAGAFYQLDTNGNGTAFGRGTANIAGHNFAFYIVDATRLKFLGTDSTEAFSGEAFAQQNMSFTTGSMNSGFAFLIAGTSSIGPISTAGRLTADGAGHLTSIFLDENNSGNVTLLPTQNTLTGTYTVDANELGGGTATWTDPTAGTFSFIFYLISPNNAVFQETDSGIASDGTLLAQTPGPVTLTALAGNFAFNWSGVSTDEEDFVGQLQLTSTSGNNVNGIMNFNEFGVSTQFINIQFKGPLAITAPGTGPNTVSVTTTYPTPTMFDFTAYVVDTNTVFLVGVDLNRVIEGTVTRQP